MFKIRPLHDRISKPVVQTSNQNNPANLPSYNEVDDTETVFVLNEETGEFTQEVRKKNNPNEETIVLDEGHNEEKQAPQQPQVPPPKRTSNFVGLSMKKNIKASFM